MHFRLTNSFGWLKLCLLCFCFTSSVSFSQTLHRKKRIVIPVQNQRPPSNFQEIPSNLQEASSVLLETPLHIAAKDLHNKSAAEVKENLRALLESGADPNIRNPREVTALSIFLQKLIKLDMLGPEAVDVTKLFLENKKIPFNLLETNYGYTPLSAFLSTLTLTDLLKEENLNPHLKEVGMLLVKHTESQIAEDKVKKKQNTHPRFKFSLKVLEFFDYDLKFWKLLKYYRFDTNEAINIAKLIVETSNKNPQLKNNVLLNFIQSVLKYSVFEDTATISSDKFLDYILNLPQMKSPENMALFIDKLRELQRYAIIKRDFNPKFLTLFKLVEAKGADLSLPVHYTSTLLHSFLFNALKHYLLKDGISPSAKEFLKFLSSNKKLIHSTEATLGNTPLAYFINLSLKQNKINLATLEITKILLEAGTDVNIKNKDEATVLSNVIYFMFKTNLYLDRKVMHPQVKELLKLLILKSDLSQTINVFKSVAFMDFAVSMLLTTRVNEDTLEILKILLADKHTDVNAHIGYGTDSEVGQSETILFRIFFKLRRNKISLTLPLISMIEEFLKAGANLSFEKNSQTPSTLFEDFFKIESARQHPNKHLQKLKGLVQSYSCSKQFQPQKI